MPDLPGWLVGGVLAVGMALIVSALSIASWMASKRQLNLRKVLSTSSFQMPFWVGFALIGTTVALSSKSIWGALTGILLMGFSSAQAILEAKKHSN